ncbi:MAG: hypothetical protein AB8H80_03205 [Planctomycetota bacterium]
MITLINILLMTALLVAGFAPSSSGDDGDAAQDCKLLCKRVVT